MGTSIGTPTTGTPEHPDTVFVDSDGDLFAEGTSADPLGSIQAGIGMAMPGETVRIRAGRYAQEVSTTRPGEPDAPITITGPPDAVFSARGAFEINHSHIHLTGLRFNGLIDRSRPADADAYAESLIIVNRVTSNAVEGGATIDESDYLTDVVVSPHRIGNCRADLIKHQYANDVEIGGFRVDGPAGVKFTLGDAVGHNAEIVYLGTPWPGKDLAADRSRNIHVHHIDNSAGHAHAELVDCKTGLSDVTIEYCTDAGGSNLAVTDDTEAGAIVVGGTEVTVRWNVLANGAHGGIEIDSDIAAAEDPPAAAADAGSNNAIYGNRLHGNAGPALQLPYAESGQGQADQRTICGNEYSGDTHGDPNAPCPDWVPTGAGVGHTGGEGAED